METAAMMKIGKKVAARLLANLPSNGHTAFCSGTFNGHTVAFTAYRTHRCRNSHLVTRTVGLEATITWYGIKYTTRTYCLPGWSGEEFAEAVSRLVGKSVRKIIRLEATQRHLLIDDNHSLCMAACNILQRVRT